MTESDKAVAEDAYRRIADLTRALCAAMTRPQVYWLAASMYADARAAALDDEDSIHATLCRLRLEEECLAQGLKLDVPWPPVFRDRVPDADRRGGGR